jgi:ABC-type branched-subunit amino acid transport system substrate-binding protein
VNVVSRWFVALLVAAVLAAACSGDSDDPAENSAAVTTGAASPDTTGGSGQSTGEDGAAVRGVTAETITLGAGLVDASEFGFDPGDIEAKWLAAVEYYNDRGGVLGRTLEVVVETYTPVGIAEAEAACIAHTEDAEVFAFVGTMRGDNVLCYTEAHNTIAINTVPITDQQIERSEALLITTAPPANSQLLSGLRQLGGEGYFRGKRVAVSHDATNAGDLAPTRALLTTLGATVVAETLTEAPAGDVLAAEVEYDGFHERWQADGADVVVAIGDNASLGAAGAVSRARSSLDVITTIGELSTYERLGHELTGAAGTIYAFTPQDAEDMFRSGGNGVRECVRRFETFSDETVVVDAEADDLANFTPTIAACRAIDTFVAIAEAAGDDLTPQSFTEAALSLGEFTLTGTEAASLGANKLSADDTPVLITVFDGDDGAFVSR